MKEKTDRSSFSTHFESDTEQNTIRIENEKRVKKYNIVQQGKGTVYHTWIPQE